MQRPYGLYYCSGPRSSRDTLNGCPILHFIRCWIDGIFGCASDKDTLFAHLNEVLACCAKFGLKPNPSKCEYFLQYVSWCGCLLSQDAIHHDPARGLIDIPPPKTAAEVQHFLGAVGWMRGGIAAIVQPLQNL